MKTRILTFLMLLFAVSAFAENPPYPHPDFHFPAPILSSDGMNGTSAALIYLDGELVETEAQLEVAFFDEEGNCRGRDFVHDWGEPFGYQFQSVMYGNSGQTLTFKFYNHTLQKSSDELGYVCKTSFIYVTNVEFGGLTEPEEVYFVHSTIYTFDNNSGDGLWKTASNWKIDGEVASTIPSENDRAIINANCKVGANANIFSVEVNGNYLLNLNRKLTASSIILNDGAQLMASSTTNIGTDNYKVIVKKEISKYTTEKNNYYLIASPIQEEFDPEGRNMLNNDFDLYYFDQTQPEKEWQNYKVNSFNLVSKNGYLYANSENTTVTFKGTVNNSKNGEEEKIWGEDMTFDANAALKGFNLVGNPFVRNAEVTGSEDIAGYYMIKLPNRNEIIAVEDPIVAPATGIFAVLSQEPTEDTYVSFATTSDNASVRKSSNNYIKIEINNSNGELEDRAIVKTGKGNGLQKYNLNNNSTKLYFNENSSNLAKVYANDATQLPLYFETREYGVYTINVKLENMNCEYLHLIDNITGMDIDLNVTPSYTFRANQGDYASRFKLVFEGTNVEENNANENFAIVEGNRVIIPMIEHETTLDIIDMTGRTISSQKVNGSFDQTLNVNAGIYLLRMNGNVQKIVVR